MPDDLQQLFDVAAALHAEGDFHAASTYYQRILERQCDHAPALAGLGVIAGQRGRNLDAVGMLRRACELTPDNPQFLYNYGEALRQSGQLEAADIAHAAALQRDPMYLPAHAGLALALQALQERAVALQLPQEASALQRRLASVFNNHGNALLGLGQVLEAIALYRRAIDCFPEYPLAWSNLGNALRTAGQVTEAEQACRRAVQLDPACSPAWNNLGNALVEQARFEEAPACYERALQLGSSPEAEHNSGSGSLFNLLCLPELSDAEIAARHREWGQAYPAPLGKVWRNSRQAERRLRIGYLSPDFRVHAMAHFIEPLLAHADREATEIVCYAQGPGMDERTRRLMQYGHRGTWVHGLDDAALARLIEDDGIDILVDCAGHTHGTRLKALAAKPAPVMMTWLGYLGTTGLPAMDYRLTDAWVDPPGMTEDQHTEKLLRVPGGMMAYQPHDDFPEVSGLPLRRNGHVTFGSLNNIQKINVTVVREWARLLQAMPDAKLLLQGKFIADAGMTGRLRGLFEAFGIRPHRLDLRPASGDFLRTYHEIDIALDTFPYGGGATTCDALWMGVPVIAFPARRPIGRLTASILHQIGHPEWLADNADAYVAKALALAADASALAEIRRGLRQRMQVSPLCDQAGFMRRLEAVYRQAWQRWLWAG
ncbi:Predicted O-linked N-acetylglucosamine transferase, SPINDLY family [Noviherbaspirillum humi]|uniref:protein O-GlcNAc transferase n=1 Tax=Noviherbaspirillum humi TaxID=1688639 RepID=A0A239C6C3_9BURK|nr:glycosyltransferase family 41 protein [Noviherbaspirillum humi]SNS15161.1 Predicted O-linked N-acetylglucosamine transferase, SPINDLY family [Noviherbaspirillum humi]